MPVPLAAISCTACLAAMQGVVHGALGSGSVMLSTFDDRSAARLVVKLDNVSFEHENKQIEMK